MKILFRNICRFSTLKKEMVSPGVKNWKVENVQGYKIEPKGSKHGRWLGT